MDSRPEVFDLRCKLFFYDNPEHPEEQRFLAIPFDRTVRLALRGKMQTRVPTVANVGRLLGVRYGSPVALWAEEAKKVSVLPGAYEHDIIQFHVWEPEKITVPDRVVGGWPIVDLSSV